MGNNVPHTTNLFIPIFLSISIHSPEVTKSKPLSLCLIHSPATTSYRIIQNTLIDYSNNTTDHSNFNFLTSNRKSSKVTETYLIRSCHRSLIRLSYWELHLTMVCVPLGRFVIVRVHAKFVNTVVVCAILNGISDTCHLSLLIP